MKAKERLYAEIGGVVGAVLTLAVCSLAPIGAQSGKDGNFDAVTCRELRVVDSKGKHHVSILSEEHGGSVGVYGETGVALMTIDERGGRINVSGNRGGAWMSIGGHGGFVSVHNKDGKKGDGALMGVEKHGGMVWAYSGGDPKATMDIDENGGRVNIAGKGSQTSQASMAVTSSGSGGVFTWDKNGRRLHKLGD